MKKHKTTDMTYAKVFGVTVNSKGKKGYGYIQISAPNISKKVIADFLLRRKKTLNTFPKGNTSKH